MVMGLILVKSSLGVGGGKNRAYKNWNLLLIG